MLQADMPQQLRELASSIEFVRESDRDGQGPRVGVADAMTTELIETLERVHLCAIMLDGEKRVLFINCHARGVLEGGGLTMRGTRIAASDRLADISLQAALDRAVESAATTKRADTELVPLPRRDSLPLVARVAVIMAEAHRPEAGVRVLVTLLDPSKAVAPCVKSLRQVFKLTPAEARVAQQLTLGRTVENVAETNRTSVGTVRLQLRSLFAKTGTARQGSLIALLSRLAVISSDATAVALRDAPPRI